VVTISNRHEAILRLASKVIHAQLPKACDASRPSFGCYPGFAEAVLSGIIDIALKAEGEVGADSKIALVQVVAQGSVIR
jgi:hypothetical protein